MKYFPLGLNLNGKPCLVVGGGSVALRKCTSLTQAGAQLTVIAPQLTAQFEPLFKTNQIQWHRTAFEDASEIHESSAMQSYVLVIAATDDPAINTDIANLCHRASVPVNVASDVDAGSALLPAIIDRGEVTVAIHSNGQSPTITRYLKQQLSAFIPRTFGNLSQWAETKRSLTKKRINEPADRQQFWQHILSGPIKDMVLNDRENQADREFNKQLNIAATGKLSGQVFLVGAGPGDPDLLTLKALKLIQQAQVVLYDRLVSDEIMSLVPDNVEKIYVGKRKSDHAVPQTDINQRLVSLAQKGLRVLRLKGGDPFIFGRGGEELELLAQSGVSFQVVPGITAASGCASYAGIPLTHRDHAQSVRFIAGQLKSEKDELDWGSLAKPNQTLVFYMGLTELSNITEKLQAFGAPSDLPAAIVEKGSTAQQRVAVGTINTLASQAQERNFRAPTLIIIGTVVNLQQQLNWFAP